MSAENSLLPQRLAADFGISAEVTRRGVKSLCRAISESRPSEFATWRELFGKTCGLDVTGPRPGIASTAELLGLSEDATTPDALLFALHTYYAMIVDRLLGRYDELKAVDPPVAGPLGWFRQDAPDEIDRLSAEVSAAVKRYDVELLERTSGKNFNGGDVFKPLYQQLFPRPLRHELGEYYTPDWLADHLLDLLDYRGQKSLRLLDPSCGSGTFLLKAIRRIRDREEGNRDARELCRAITDAVVGFDLNPLAVLTAKANYLIAIRDLAAEVGEVDVPVYLCDSILDSSPGEERGDLGGWGIARRCPSSQPSGAPPRYAPATHKHKSHGALGRFDIIVGNPPWIAWDNLPDDYRELTKPLWQRYGLFTLSGNEARHGGGKKDLSSLMLSVSADRWLAHRGRLAMVITQTLFQSKGAGDGFRRFRLGPDGPLLGVLRVDDMVAIKPFEDAANWTATILLEKGTATEYPVEYVEWLRDGTRLRQQPCLAEPIDVDSPGSPWLVCPKDKAVGDLRRMVGPSDYTAHLGANSGGANGVYWLEVLEKSDDGVLVQNMAGKGKRQVEQVRAVIEPDLLYPLIRWGDVSRFAAKPSAHILLAQDVDTRKGIDEELMRRRYPMTYRYLERFRDLLVSRSAYHRYQGRGSFYSMYNVGRYSISPLKVVWRRMDRRINAAVVEPSDDPLDEKGGQAPQLPVVRGDQREKKLQSQSPFFIDPLLGPRPAIPQETCVLIDCQSAAEAHYICAVLNSSPVNELISAHSVHGGKSFGTPGMLQFVNLRRFDPDNRLHAELAERSVDAHLIDDHESIQERIDDLAARLWAE